MTKNLLISGSAGFIASNLIELLQIEYSNKYNLYHVDMLSDVSDKNFWDSLPSDNKHCGRVGEISAQLLEKWKIDLVIHAAASSHVDNSIKDPLSFTNLNVVDTNLLFEACRQYGKIGKIILLSTDEVLGSLGPNDNPFIETDLFKPNSPYSASKACQEMLARAYVETYELPIVVTRCSNNYGPRQANEKLIPKAIECLMSGNKIPVYGNGLNIRDWIHVQDHCRGIISALEKGLIGQTYHFGGNSELSNLELIDKIIEVFYLVNCWCYDPNNLTKHMEFVKDRLGHDQRYAMNYGKAFHELNWLPTYSFANGIYETVKWYVKNSKNG